MDRTFINNIVKAATNSTVQSGPFSGVKIVDNYAWGDGDISAKLLGLYEQELHTYLQRFSSNIYNSIFDVGCAEGFYAVGLAKMFPNNLVYAFDPNPQALVVASQTAVHNDVNDRVILGEHCSPADLSRIVSASGRSLIVIDCEGFEKQLLCDEQVVTALRTSDMIVECHDYKDPEITGSITSKYFKSHTVDIVYSGGRNPNVFPFLANLTDPERWMAISENRICRMHWLVLEAKER